MEKGLDNTAILNYNQVASMFLEQERNKNSTTIKTISQNKNLGICLNNIACIHAKNNDWQKANIYFASSISIC